MSRGGRGYPSPDMGVGTHLPGHETWDTTGYRRQAGGTHSTGVLLVYIYYPLTCKSALDITT